MPLPIPNRASRSVAPFAPAGTAAYSPNASALVRLALQMQVHAGNLWPLVLGFVATALTASCREPPPAPAQAPAPVAARTAASAPASPTALQIFAGPLATDALEDKPVCKTAKAGILHCREPHTYWVTNEPDHAAVATHLQNRGGAYIGIGAAQNYTLIAQAQSGFAWLADYDPRIVRLHEILLRIITKSPSPADFIAHWQPENAPQAAALFEPGGARLAETAHLVFNDKPGAKLRAYFQAQARAAPDSTPNWLNRPESYAYIRKLAQEHRIRPVPGDLLRQGTLPAIAAAARRMNVPVRVVYLSNAPEYWSPLPQAFVDNLRTLPFDDRTAVFIAFGHKSAKATGHKWLFHVAGGPHLQATLAGPGPFAPLALAEPREPAYNAWVTTHALKP